MFDYHSTKKQRETIPKDEKAITLKCNIEKLLRQLHTIGQLPPTDDNCTLLEKEDCMLTRARSTSSSLTPKGRQTQAEKDRVKKEETRTRKDQDEDRTQQDNVKEHAQDTNKVPSDTDIDIVAVAPKLSVMVVTKRRVLYISANKRAPNVIVLPH
ncbi:hypothetical protein P692DRAFT_201808279 [Suillus brevipes Sb2]|nr:hypothetical protein P692DRAFT_201808279 [Suillus brevipes Sb2]